MSRFSRVRDRVLPPVIVISAIAGLVFGAFWYLDPQHMPTPGPTLGPTSKPVAGSTTGPALGDVVATRLVIRSLGIDLPVVSGTTRVPDQGPDAYPPCDVALYLTKYVQPGERGTTYIYAHAREGMFLPLLVASERDDGAALLGTLVEVYTSDDQQHVYEISTVKRHALDFSLAQDIPRRAQRLVLQTSEGPRGTVPKLQILAKPVATLPAAVDDAHPVARPRACYHD